MTIDLSTLLYLFWEQKLQFAYKAHKFSSFIFQMQEEEDRVLKEHEEQLLKDFKEAVGAKKEGRKITRQTKPAIVLKNRELPEIPEFKMEDPLPNNFTGDDAIWYMFRLS